MGGELMGRDKKNENRPEHWTKLVRNMMTTPAWRALSPTAQALYPWIKMEWKGPQANNNGKLQLSVRQAAELMGVGLNTAARAFHDLQAKGFLVVVKPAVLGIKGEASAPEYELTEMPLWTADREIHRQGRHLFKQWQPGRDFPVQKARTNNPSGRNGKTKSQPQNDDASVIEMKTYSREASSK